jgi:polyphosphate kinase 2 (PPK2 family)
MSTAMTQDKSPPDNSRQSKIYEEMLDSFDEELELELDDHRLEQMLDGIADQPDRQTAERQFYFKELFRLQRELVKLQDWVVQNNLKVVVIFEGRDAAGKGGAIKRITQRLNPRVCRVVALPARMSAKNPSGISSATSPICRRAARSCCSTGAGTIAPASNA